MTNPSSVHCTAAVVSSVKCKYDKIGDNYSATRVSAGAGAAADGMNITPAARCPLIVSMLESSTGGSHGASDLQSPMVPGPSSLYRDHLDF